MEAVKNTVSLGENTTHAIGSPDMQAAEMQVQEEFEEDSVEMQIQKEHEEDPVEEHDDAEHEEDPAYELPDFIKEASKDYFNQYPERNLFYATADGNFFFEEDLHIAKGHSSVSKQQLLTLKRDTNA